MTNDIVERLRIAVDESQWEMPLASERERLAADEIERLRAEVDLKGYRIDALSAEIERLRVAGDAVIEVALGVRPWITPLFAMEHRDRIDGAVATWNEATR
jgi:hypothetical protein